MSLVRTTHSPDHRPTPRAQAREREREAAAESIRAISATVASLVFGASFVPNTTLYGGVSTPIHRTTQSRPNPGPPSPTPASSTSFPTHLTAKMTQLLSRHLRTSSQCSRPGDSEQIPRRCCFWWNCTHPAGFAVRTLSDGYYINLDVECVQIVSSYIRPYFGDIPPEDDTRPKGRWSGPMNAVWNRNRGTS